MVETGLDTTAHCIPHILGKPMWSFRLMWLVCFLASCAGCGYLLARSLSDYLNYEVVTTICKVPDSPALFPAVTLCNTNLITNRYASNYVWSKIIEADGHFSNNSLWCLQLHQVHCNTWELYRSEILWGYMDQQQGLAIKFWSWEEPLILPMWTL